MMEGIESCFPVRVCLPLIPSPLQHVYFRNNDRNQTKKLVPPGASAIVSR